MRVTVVVLIILLAVLALSNPGMDAFKAYIEDHAEAQLLHEMGDTKAGRVFSHVGGSLAGALIDQVSERDNYLVFSVYTIDLDGEEKNETQWRFLGIAGQFVKFQKPKDREERE